MKNNVPSQDSTRCYGKYCTHFVSKTHGKTCPSCGAYICQTCFHEKGCCRDCEDILMETQVQIDRIESSEADMNRKYYEDVLGKATNFTPEELKQMEDGWKFYDKVMLETPDSKVGLHHDHMCICGRESKIGTNLCPDCDVDELVALGLD